MSTAVLLHFDGTPGSQVFVDEFNGLTFTADDSNQTLATAAAVFGATGLSLPTANGISAVWPPYLDLSTKFTIEFIWKTGSSPNSGYVRILCSNQDTSSPFSDQLMFLTVNSGVLAMYTGVYGSADTSMTFPDFTFAANTAYRIALTRDASNVVRAFKDGVISASTYTTATNWNHVGKKLQIGSSHNSASPFSGDQFNGTQGVGGIDELRISDECLYTASYTPASTAFTLETVDSIPSNDGMLVRRFSSVGTLSSDGRTYTSSGVGQDESLYGPVGCQRKTGKWYFEVTCITPTTEGTNAGWRVGVADAPAALITSANVPNPGDTTTGVHSWNSLGDYNDYYNNAQKDGPSFNGHNFDGTIQASGFNNAGDVVGVLWDTTTSSLKFYCNGMYVNTAPKLIMGLRRYAPFMGVGSNSVAQFKYNGGEETFSYTPGSETGYHGWDLDPVPDTALVTLTQFNAEVLSSRVPKAYLTQFNAEVLSKRVSDARVLQFGMEVLARDSRVLVTQFNAEVLRPYIAPVPVERRIKQFGLEVLLQECPAHAGGGNVADDTPTPAEYQAMIEAESGLEAYMPLQETPSASGVYWKHSTGWGDENAHFATKELAAADFIDSINQNEIDMGYGGNWAITSYAPYTDSIQPLDYKAFIHRTPDTQPTSDSFIALRYFAGATTASPVRDVKRSIDVAASGSNLMYAQVMSTSLGLGIKMGSGGALGLDGSWPRPSNVKDEFALEAWMIAPTVETVAAGFGAAFYSGGPLISCEVAGVTNDFGLTYVGTTPAFGVGSPDETITTRLNLSDGQPHHIVANRKVTGNSELWIDGVLVGSLNFNDDASLTASAVMHVGNGPEAGVFQGTVAHLAVYSVALTSAQIITHYNAGIGTVASTDCGPKGAILQFGLEVLVLSSSVTGGTGAIVTQFGLEVLQPIGSAPLHGGFS